MKYFDPEALFILRWNKTFLICSGIALSLDPLFLYIPIIDRNQNCLAVDRKLQFTLCILRSLADMLFVFYIIIQFRTAYIDRSTRMYLSRVWVVEPRYVARHYIMSSFIIDVLAVLPLPQLAVWVIIPKLDGPVSYLTKNLLKFIILSQLVPRVIRISLLYQKVTEISGFLTETAWTGASYNFLLYVLASHVVGAFWYLFAIESEMRCWNIACERNNCYSNHLYCGEGQMVDYRFLNTSCPLLERNEIKDSINFDFGIFLDALQTRVLETRNLPQKLLYCSWWGLQSLSSVGQGLKTSTFYGEILFADFIAVMGLVLFALLIGNIQKYLQSFSNFTLRVEEMKEKTRETEELMSHIHLHEDLRKKVRRHKQYQWKINRGFQLDSFLRDLPRDLRRDIMRYLCLNLLKNVPFLEQMDERFLETMFDGLKPVLYIKDSYIFREGDSVREILFLTSGEVLSITTDGGRTGFFESMSLKAGDLCGDELLTWAFGSATPGLPFSSSTAKAVRDVQAFALSADDLMRVASKFKRLHGSLPQHTLRYYSKQWRTWAACYIQHAWRSSRYKRQETSTINIGSSVYPSRFSTNILRRNHVYNAQVSTPRLQTMLPLKPTL